MRVLLVSTYDMGHQPIDLAIMTAAARAGGHEVRCLDLSVETVEPGWLEWPEAIVVSVPMHTALRLARPILARRNLHRPDLPIALVGLYSAMVDPQEGWSITIPAGIQTGMVEWLASLAPPAIDPLPPVDRLVPDRSHLPPLSSYARLMLADRSPLAAQIRTTTGCRHRCRHCPVPVVHDGRIKIVPVDLVAADADYLYQEGVRHLSITDPDFLNAPVHSMKVLSKLADQHPDMTFDITVKVSHILKHSSIWPELASFGVLFVVSAFESIDNSVLAHLDKGHTAEQALAALRIVRSAGIELRPSWMPFTPWTTRAQLADLLHFVEDNDLIESVDTVQYSIRLLIPPGSLLLSHPDVVAAVERFDAELVSWVWKSPDPSLDELQKELARVAEELARDGRSPAEGFQRVAELIGLTPSSASLSPGEGLRPRLSEPWFCCAEPTGGQFGSLMDKASTGPEP